MFWLYGRYINMRSRVSECRGEGCTNEMQSGRQGYCHTCAKRYGVELSVNVYCKNHPECANLRKSGLKGYCQSCAKEEGIAKPAMYLCSNDGCTVSSQSMYKGFCYTCFHEHQVRSLKTLAKQGGSIYPLYFVDISEVPMSRSLWKHMRHCEARWLIDIFYDIPIEADGPRRHSGKQKLRSFLTAVGIDPFCNPFEDNELFDKIRPFIPDG